MGILNVTPDSFFDGGRYTSSNDQVAHVERMLDEGATLIDIGAASSRPGSELLSPAGEWARLEPVLRELVRAFPQTWFSVDTYHAETAGKAVQEGVALINDISGGQMDTAMFETVAAHRAPYILMHMQGTPQSMQHDPTYGDVVQEVIYSLAERVQQLHQLGVHDVILDPGFGFGKTVEHNYALLRHLPAFAAFELPLMVGVSRKSMINRVLGTTPERALNGTTVLHTLALQQGADILRVHDVREAVECIKLVTQYNQA